jgi:hypothetical protein
MQSINLILSCFKVLIINLLQRIYNFIEIIWKSISKKYSFGKD